LTAAEIAQHREQAHLRHAQRLAQSHNMPHVGGMYDYTWQEACIIYVVEHSALFLLDKASMDEKSPIYFLPVGFFFFQFHVLAKVNIN
jgi:hypothetical protein